MTPDQDQLSGSLLREVQELLRSSDRHVPKWMLRRAMNTIEALQGRLAALEGPTGGKMTREECLSITGDEDLLFAEGFDHAILGVAQRFNDFFVVYDQTRVVETLMTRDGMSYEEATEFFEFNIGGAWLGDKTPGFLLRSDA